MRNIADKEFMGVLKVGLYTQLAATLSCVIDGIFVSRYLGSNAMTAYGIAAPYFSLVAIIIFALLIGGQSIYTAKIGQNRTDEARGAFGLTLWLTLALSVVLSVVGIVFVESIASLMGARGEAADLLPLTCDYLGALFLGTLFNGFITVSGPALQLDSYGGLVKATGIVVCVADIVGDAAAIFVFHAGLKGIGLATSFGYVIGAAVIGTYFVKKDSLFSLNPKLVDMSFMGQLLKGSYSQSVFFLCTFISPMIVNNLIISNAGVAAMTAISIERNAAMFFNTLCYAIADAVFLLTNLHYGELDKNEVEGVRKTAYSMFNRLVLPVAFMIVVLSGLIARVYVTDDTTGDFMLAKQALIALGVNVPMYAVFNISLKRLQALQRSATAMVLALGQALAFSVLTYYVLTRALGVKGMLCAIILTELLSMILAIVLDGAVRKDDSLFPIGEEDILRYTVKAPEDCSKLSMRVNGFCMLHGVDEKNSFRMSICAEDMAYSIFEQAGEKTDIVVELRLFVLGNQTTMIIKDNCPQINLKEKAEQWRLDSEHPDAYMGARIALKMSSDLNYLQTLNTNTLIITFENVEIEE